MSAEEQLSQLQKEVQRLAEQLNVNDAKIQQLEQELAQLRKRTIATAPIAFSQPSKKQMAVKDRLGMENFIGLNLIHLVGIVILVIGLSIGVKYAIDKNLISEFARVGLAYAAGIVLYLLSWRLQKKYQVFSSILFSGGMASLYFTTYAAFVYYGMFSISLAFIIMIALTVFTAYKAIAYNRQEIVILGLVGAYAIPFLISSNSGRADLFFTYIAIINCAVVFLSYKKSWKAVGALAQLATWILFLGWSWSRYTPQLQGVGVAAMCFFFLLFEFNILSGRLLRLEPLTIREGQQLIINDIALFLGALFLFNHSYANLTTATICGCFALFGAVQTVLLHYWLPNERSTEKLHALLALVWLVMFIAFEWDGVLVTLLWLATAVALFVAGLTTKWSTLRIWSILLMGVTLLKLVVVDSIRFSTVQKIISYITLGVLLLVVSFFYQKFRQKLFGDDV